MTEHPYDGAEGRPLLDLVIKGMSVVDSDGTHIGTVDKVEGGHLKILRPDQRPRNQRQYVTPNWIVAVDDRVRPRRPRTTAARFTAGATRYRLPIFIAVVEAIDPIGIGFQTVDLLWRLLRKSAGWNEQESISGN
jgi:hypothetical protein